MTLLTYKSQSDLQPIYDMKGSRKSRRIYLYLTFKSFMNMLCFDLLTRPKMPFKVMHRKEMTHSNGSYERKSRGRKLADEMGRARKIPMVHYRVILLTNPSARAGYDTRSIFKRSLTGLNSEFSFS